MFGVQLRNMTLSVTASTALHNLKKQSKEKKNKEFSSTKIDDL
jgi:hypothetical protein